MTGPGTLGLRADLGPDLQDMAGDYGKDIVIVTGAGNATWGTSAAAGGTTIQVRGVLMPADVRRQQAAAGAGLPVPAFEAYLPYRGADGQVLPLDAPGWHLRYDGRAYYPTADARDEGLQGVVWIVELSAPGEVTTRVENQSSWADPP